MKKVLLLIPLYFLPYVVSAQNTGLVTCQGPDCNICDFVALINNVINFLVGLLVILAVFLMVIAGFRLVTSAGNPSALSQAKQSLTNVIIGFIILLSAWLIVDTFLKALTGRGLEQLEFIEIQECRLDNELIPGQS